LKTQIAVLIGLVGAVSAQAAELQPRSGFSVSASLGVNQATGPSARSGAGISAAGEYSPTSWFTLGLTSGYSAPSSDPSGEFHDTTVYLDGFAQFSANLRALRPLFQIGGGHYRFRSNATTGGFVGIGIEVPAGHRWFIPLTVRYHSVRTAAGDDPDFAEWRIGIARTFGRS
jgi:hypothetical protein